MSDWFRNETWNAGIEKAFFEKLRRSRQKEQYLRIQAYHLRNAHPAVALRLLDELFSLEMTIDRALALTHKAEAHLALNDLDAAIEAYEAALAREAEFPNVVTDAHLDLPLLIAVKRIGSRYPQALDILEKYQPPSLVFPVVTFRRQAARAIILCDLGQAAEAKSHAADALEASRQENSGLRYHPQLGLVGVEYDATVKLLRKIAA